MDCEQFDQIVVDLLYGELGEAEAASARRHTDGCDRCLSHLTALRETRKAVALSVQEPPVGFEDRILDVARRAQREIPWLRRLGRAVSWAGSYAMRPQLAMAALLLLMIGSSLLLLRGRPGNTPVGMVRVTEHGVPERDPYEQLGPGPARTPTQAEVPRSGARASEMTGEPLGAIASGDRRERASGASPSREGAERAERAEADPGASSTGQEPGGPAQAPPAAAEQRGSSSDEDLSNAARSQPMPMPEADTFAEAMEMYKAREYVKAYRAFDAIAAQGGANAPSAALYAARAVRSSAGCGTALPRFETVSSRYSGSAAGVQAKWEAASCYRMLGNTDKARQLLQELRNTEGQQERADQELARMNATGRAAASDKKGAAPPAQATGKAP
jgi:hypothetical protein